MNSYGRGVGSLWKETYNLQESYKKKLTRILYVERFLLGVSLVVVVQRYSVKKVFFKISQNSQENTCVRISFSIKLQACYFIEKETLTQVFSCEFCEILKNTFLLNTSDGCFCFFKIHDAIVIANRHLFLGYNLYVPKLPKGGKSIEWRKCYSREEKDLFKRIDGVNECRKHCVRITKALFGLHSNGLFKCFTSYFIKTVAFQLKDNKEINWKEENLGECIMFFLKKIQKHLEKKNLRHTFEPTINLLEGIKCDELSSTLKNKLKSENDFLEWLD